LLAVFGVVCTINDVLRSNLLAIMLFSLVPATEVVWVAWLKTQEPVRAKQFFPKGALGDGVCNYLKSEDKKEI